MLELFTIALDEYCLAIKIVSQVMVLRLFRHFIENNILKIKNILDQKTINLNMLRRNKVNRFREYKV